MKRNYFLNMVLAVVLLTCCHNKKETVSDDAITCIGSIKDTELKLSQIIKSYKFIPLETTTESLI